MDSLLIAAVPVVCSLIVYSTVLRGSTLQGIPLLPGIIVGLYASVIASGNPHGGSLAVAVAVALVVNYCCFTGLAYFGVRFYQKIRSNRE